MILGIGTDIVELRRIEAVLSRRGDSFIRRITRPGEVLERHPAALVPHVGGLFAAKEAVLKALGTGWAAGLTLRQVEVRRNSEGRPEVVLHQAAEARRTAMGGGAFHLSISHEKHYAIATAVLESRTAD